MAKQRLWNDQYHHGLEINASGMNWRLAAGSSVYGRIIEGPEFLRNTIIVDGIVSSPDMEALQTNGKKTSIEIGNGGVISAKNGIFSYGEASAVINNGHLVVADNGISISGSGSTATNNGVINANSYGMIANADDQRIVNGKSGEINSLSPSIFLATDTGEHATAVNHGRIVTGEGGAAIQSANGNDRIVNDGIIVGNVDLGDGNDVFDARGGTVRGVIYGGFGQDTLITDSAKVTFADDGWAGSDIDTVKSTVTYTLTNFVDRLFLMGTKNINGTGNVLDNTLAGNNGNNILRGAAGVDSLDGGKGNDTLFGGTDADTFGFATGYGKDTIADFSAGEGDHIYVANWKAIDSFGQVKNHAQNHGADVWITVGKDMLIIEDMHKADLAAGDFQF